MRHVAAIMLSATVIADAALAQAVAYTCGLHTIVLPADRQQRCIRDTTLDKPDRKSIRNMFINPEAFAALRPGQPLPCGSVVVMADQRARLDADGRPLIDGDGRPIPEPAFIALAVQQRERGWGEGYRPELGNGEREHARFTAQTSARIEGPLNACVTCHLLARAQQDFTFTTWDYATRPR